MGFSKILLKLRKDNNVTQKELGDAIGVGKTTISNYETDYSTPDLETLVKIADYFNVSTDHLLGRLKDNKQTEFKNLFQRFMALMKDQGGAGATESMVMIILEILKLSATMNGIPPSAVPDIWLSESKVQELAKELGTSTKAQDNNPTKDMIEQINQLSPQGQNAIKSMLEALKTKDDKAAVDETTKRWEPLAAHRDDNPMDDLPENAIHSMEAAQKAYLDEFKHHK